MTYQFNRDIYINNALTPIATYEEETDGERPRKWKREQIVAILALSLCREQSGKDGGATAFDEREVEFALGEVSCGNKIEIREIISKSYSITIEIKTGTDTKTIVTNEADKIKEILVPELKKLSLNKLFLLGFIVTCYLLSAFTSVIANVASFILLTIKLIAVYYPVPSIDFSWLYIFAPFAFILALKILNVFKSIVVGFFIGVKKALSENKNK